MRARDNPFRVERLHALRFRPQGDNWPSLLRGLESNDRRGAIVGPCGSGKTTLLEELATHFANEGWRVTRVFLNDESKHVPLDSSFDSRDIVLIDGADLLTSLAWWRLQRRLRPAGGVIITAHRRSLLPTLLETQTSPALLAALVEELAGECDAARVADLHRRHGGNLRNALSELYDVRASVSSMSESPTGRLVIATGASPWNASEKCFGAP